jgi:hypothetical protein
MWVYYQKKENENFSRNLGWSRIGPIIGSDDPKEEEVG